MKESVICFIVLVLLCVIAFGTSCVQTYFEMKAFNKFSKTKATFIEAYFTNLRVIPD